MPSFDLLRLSGQIYKCVTQRFMIKTKSRYSFEDCGTDRQTEPISEFTLKELSNNSYMNYMICLSKLEISWRRLKQHTYPGTLDERNNKTA